MRTSTALLCLSVWTFGCGSSPDGNLFDEGSGGQGGWSGGGGSEGVGANGVGAGPSGSGSGSGNGTGAPSSSSTGTGGVPGCYAEPLDGSADISDIIASYGGSNYKSELIEALDRRWPAGGYLLSEQINDSYFAQFSDPNSWNGMVSWIDTLVHEETHLYNAELSFQLGAAHALYFTEDLAIALPAEQGFPRSEIKSQLASFAQNGIYATTYLTGSQGQRGFNPLLDETSCYSNEVPGLAAFGQYYQGGVSLRDGSAAMLYFIQVYLRVARTNHAAFYDWAKSQDSYREAVRTLWLRTHFFFQLADQYPNLGISDQQYRDEAHKAENLLELELFTGSKLGDSNCILD